MISVATKRKMVVKLFVCLLLFERKLRKKKFAKCGRFQLKSHISHTYTLSVAQLKKMGGKQ